MSFDSLRGATQMTAIKSCFLVQLVALAVTGCTGEPVDPELRTFLGPLTGRGICL